MAFIIGNNNELFPNGTGSHLLWNNKAATASNTSNSTVNEFNIGYIFDYLSTTTWFANAPVNNLIIESAFTSPEAINCVAFAGTDFSSSDVVSITVKDENDDIVEVFDASQFEDNKPVMLLFDAYEFSTIKIDILINGGNSITISNMYVGRTIEFPCQPDVGYQPGKWNNERVTKSFKTQNNAFGRNITSERGTKEVANFSLLPMEFMDTDYSPFVQQHAGWPVFFAWDKINYPDEVIFGQVQKGKSAFTTGIHSSVGLTFTGNI